VKEATRRSGFDTTGKAQFLMMRDGGAVLPVSDSSSRPGETSAGLASTRRQRWWPVPQRAAGLQEWPMPRIRPERSQTQGQVQNLRREVEQLRVEMHAMRAGHQDQPRMTEEPPPGYAEQVGAP
jgi:hypothetical protein